MIGSKTLAYRYARALADLGLAQDKLEEFGRELASIKELFESVPDSAQILKKPLFPKDKRELLLSEIISQLNLSQITSNFLTQLLEKNRIEILNLILESYQEIVDQLVSRIRAKVFSARPLLDEEKNKLAQTLKRRFGAKDAVLDCKVDVDLIGGVKVEIRSVVFDASLKNQLARIQSQLVEE